MHTPKLLRLIALLSFPRYLISKTRAENGDFHAHASFCIASPKPSGGDDVVYVDSLPDGTLMAILADGASGGGFGRLAANTFVDLCKSRLSSFDHPDSHLKHLFIDSDFSIMSLDFACETTGIVFLVKDNQYICVTTGDSEVWMLSEEGTLHISSGQFRKARMGGIIPSPEVKRGNITGPVLIASDGLEYAMKLPDALEILKQQHPNRSEAIVKKAEELSTFGLPDDLSVITII